MSVIYIALNIMMAIFTVYGMYCFIHDEIFKFKKSGKNRNGRK